jgi:tetratricopeptide (TPR) repeat protein
LNASGNVARGYARLGRCEEAEEITQNVLTTFQDTGRVRNNLAYCWTMHRAEYEKAIDLLNKEPVGFLRETGLAINYNKAGQQDKAQKHLDLLIESNGEAASYQYAQVYAQWGDADKALGHLEHAWEIRDPGFTLINGDDFLDPLRDHPRFKALMDVWRDPSKH